MAHGSSSLSDIKLRKILGTRDPRLTEREQFIDKKVSDGETLRRCRSSEQFEQTLGTISRLANRNKIKIKRSKSLL